MREGWPVLTAVGAIICTVVGSTIVLSNQIGGVEARLSERIDGVETRLTARIEILEAQDKEVIDRLARLKVLVVGPEVE